ncbi:MULTISPECIES: hypothetical protein [Vibrio]|uniref:hypothetical protein n=1 Tax=Vibrio TaxID=662 RepID=UPI001965C550|nr:MULTISPECIES: hypothetical protein [unclassified Vibrio]EGU0168392.1 hypothetical protein [Vibrio parahaemolyticus]ELB2830235.1 hypothetical protein [Vibrio alginolyticus]MDF4376514.1 hypothetical protein [Vibrio parahaemolyticus]QRZ23751.1 hypothetical protein H9L11_06715 [Vibrio sp. sp1]HCG8238230.1 hypothetical protein [Vibrio parahaemolyticus]
MRVHVWDEFKQDVIDTAESQGVSTTIFINRLIKKELKQNAKGGTNYETTKRNKRSNTPNSH